MRLPIVLLAASLLLSGTAHAQDAKQNEKAKAYMVADAHLDTQWNWDIQTTINEYVWNTLSRNLSLLDKYPNYVFNFEGGVKYAWMKEYYPTEYARLKDHVRSGRWHISGSGWDATDALVPSIESAIRNILLAQDFYREEFGVESTDIFLPDCFGFGWTLPTIAKHCGLIGFSSQKLGWRNNPFYGDKKYPFTIGLWEGVDGSTIMMAHGYDYGKRWNNIDLSESEELMKLARQSPLNTVYRYYGTGDVGGSPTLASVNSVEKGLRGNGPLEIISATSDQLYKDYLPYENHPELPRFNGELLMDVHGTGCYTSQAAMKLYNRQNEILGDAAERASVAADWLGVAVYPGESLTESWRRFIFHQFHDDLTGTSIPRAYEFSWNDELLSLKQFSGVLTSAVGAVSERMDTRVKGTPVVFYNALGYPVTDIVEVSLASAKRPSGVSVYDANGKKAASQLVSYENGKATFLVEATVPSAGYAVYDVRLSGPSAKAVDVAANTLENSIYKISLNANGDISSLVDKRNGKELVENGKAIRLALFTENESFSWPAWEVLKKTVDSEPVSITDDVKMTLVENGSLRKTLLVEKRHGESIFRQYISLYEGKLADRIDFRNDIDWQSTNALLKAEFPLSVSNEEATYDLGVGTVRRGNNTLTAYEVYAQRWADLTDKSGEYGVSVMNDSKYGWDKPDDNTIRLTLLHTPKTKRGYTYQDRQDWGRHTFTYSLVGHAGELDKALTGKKADVLNQRVQAFATAKHPGDLGKTFSFASSDNENIVIKALKKAESSDDYVVRVYETGGASEQDASLAFAGKVVSAEEADGTEKTIGKATVIDGKLAVSVKPNSIKTYKIRLEGKGKGAESAKYQSLPLDYDRKCFSWNEFRGSANFDAGYSYAAELVPAEMTVNRVPFHLETKEELDGLTCEGDTLRFPAGHSYNRLYVLAAAASDNDVKGTFTAGKNTREVVVPSYTGFIGQWGHKGHTKGFLKDADVAYVGTHRHSTMGNHAYEFTYMFKYGIDIPEGVTEVVLPDNKDIVIFAATLADEPFAQAKAVSTLFRTANENDINAPESEESRINLLKPEQVIAYSGYCNDREKPIFLVDGKEDTKWCDLSTLPNYVDFDLGEVKELKGWEMLNAASESNSYVTSGCFIQGKNKPEEEWRTLDFVTGNRLNVVKRSFGKTENARYLRLLVTQPVQQANGGCTRIYELSVY